MYGDYNLRREKRYVEVDVRFTPDGKIRPLAINYDKTRTYGICLLYTSPSPRDGLLSRMPSSA